MGRRSGGRPAPRPPDLLADLVVEGARTLAFVRSRRGAEVARPDRPAAAAPSATGAGRPGGGVPGGLPPGGASRAGAAPADGDAARASPPPTRSSWASTSPAWTPSCWPASPARSRRSGSRPDGPGGQRLGALVVFVARDDPLDTYLVHHPEARLRPPGRGDGARPGEPVRARPAAVLRGGRAAADRRRPGAVRWRGARAVLPDLVRRGLLRRRPTGWYWTARGRPDLPTSAAPAASR